MTAQPFQDPIDLLHPGALPKQDRINIGNEPNPLRRLPITAAAYRHHPAALMADTASYLADLVDELRDFAHFCRALARLLGRKAKGLA